MTLIPQMKSEHFPLVSHLPNIVAALLLTNSHYLQPKRDQD